MLVAGVVIVVGAVVSMLKASLGVAAAASALSVRRGPRIIEFLHVDSLLVMSTTPSSKQRAG